MGVAILTNEVKTFQNDAFNEHKRIIVSDLTLLEVCQILIKSGHSPEKVRKAFSTLREMVEYGFLKVVPFSQLGDEVKELIIALKLDVSHAVNCVTALKEKTLIVSEHGQLHRPDVEKYMDQ